MNFSGHEKYLNFNGQNIFEKITVMKNLNFNGHEIFEKLTVIYLKINGKSADRPPI